VGTGGGADESISPGKREGPSEKSCPSLRVERKSSEPKRGSSWGELRGSPKAMICGKEKGRGREGERARSWARGARGDWKKNERLRERRAALRFRRTSRQAGRVRERGMPRHGRSKERKRCCQFWTNLTLRRRGDPETAIERHLSSAGSNEKRLGKDLGGGGKPERRGEEKGKT